MTMPAGPDPVEKLPFPDADLRVHPPRSPRVMLGGLYFLARTIDKTRAKLQGTLGLLQDRPRPVGVPDRVAGDHRRAVHRRGAARDHR